MAERKAEWKGWLAYNAFDNPCTGSLSPSEHGAWRWMEEQHGTSREELKRRRYTVRRVVVMEAGNG